MVYELSISSSATFLWKKLKIIENPININRESLREILFLKRAKSIRIQQEKLYDLKKVFCTGVKMEGRFLLHWKDPNNWRLRNPKRHPCYPNWETGKYAICHNKIIKLTDVGTKILDVVVKDGKPVVRSAFQISKTQGEGFSKTLLFDEFYFADNEPIELEKSKSHIKYRQMFLETYKDKTLWNRIIKEYTEYEKGQKPKSIPQESWDNMVNICASELKRKMPKSDCETNCK
jgi:hypothetical protein